MENTNNNNKAGVAILKPKKIKFETTISCDYIRPGKFHGLYNPWGLRVGHDWVTFKKRKKHKDIICCKIK